ncbi:acetylesterase [Anaerofilum sp. BX8]|uniref:Acetylesterase n=1 Tax=Anaerofilum hominis TaxID=2763016 RepID=A0A923I7I7_9FIRM|nr:alpha/beta hydrolase-fold protein [Anaerofilum hominis]MBC5581725.1 acetylesterase [Anaerofilum hominis]
MALLRIELFSKALMRTVPVTAVVPVDNVRYDGDPVRPADKPYKTLYLLNGIYGNNMDWICASGVMMWAQERSLAVIMPAGENHFYVDCAATGEGYGRFVGEELVEQTRRLFHLSREREDTYIAGLSMGGYGAIRNGLKYSETFGYAAGLSSGLIQDRMMAADDSSSDYTQRRSYYQAIFGDLDRLAGSDKDCEALYLRARQAGVVPRLYLACGTEDFLIEPNRRYRDFLQAQGADLTYEEGPGIHDFNFWSEYLQHVLNWLPLEEKAAGISSGNVRREK